MKPIRFLKLTVVHVEFDDGDNLATKVILGPTNSSLLWGDVVTIHEKLLAGILPVTTTGFVLHAVADKAFQSGG